MSKKNAPAEDELGFKLLEEEMNEERVGFDLRDRLTKRPKRKPIEATVSLDDEAIEELGYARDVERRNEFGVVVKTVRVREGVLGDLDREQSKPEGERDEKAIASLKKRAKALIKRIKENSLTLTLQWVPKMTEEIIEVRAMRSIGVKQAPVPQEKSEEYGRAYAARMIEATTVSVLDNQTGEVKSGLTVREAEWLRQQLEASQYDILDLALGKLQRRAAISQEVLDSADF